MLGLGLACRKSSVVAANPNFNPNPSPNPDPNQVHLQEEQRGPGLSRQLLEAVVRVRGRPRLGQHLLVRVRGRARVRVRVRALALASTSCRVAGLGSVVRVVQEAV